MKKMVKMAKNSKMEQEIQDLKKVVDKLSKAGSAVEEVEANSGVSALVKYMLDENAKRDKVLRGIFERLKRLEEELTSMEEVDHGMEIPAGSNREIPLSNLDSKILEIAQAKGMVCADDIKGQMNYKGRNAACARLNRLHRAGLLDRIQLGHKVYFKYDAGKTTNTLIISPPQ